MAAGQAAHLRAQDLAHRPVALRGRPAAALAGRRRGRRAVQTPALGSARACSSSKPLRDNAASGLTDGREGYLSKAWFFGAYSAELDETPVGSDDSASRRDRRGQAARAAR
ncbi:hypothetical protein K7G98_01180 [Saccharothrix sp. MB29]|nr:hypothetical protein [Saccharothrix sp. MB29]